MLFAHVAFQKGVRRNESSFVLKFIAIDVGLSSMKTRMGKSLVRIHHSDLSSFVLFK